MKSVKGLIKILCFFIVAQAQAQDIIGAHIHTQYVPSTNTFTPIYQYSITLTLLCDASQNIARPTVSVSFGDTNGGTLSISNTQPAGNGITIKTYSGTHTYAGPNPPQSNYRVQYLDSFRIAGIKNVPNSSSQKILAETRIYANTVSYTNTTVAVANNALNLSLSGNDVIFDPGASDAEGDSLSFSLVNCYATSYYIPSGAAVNFSTGVVSFSKDSLGLYAFCLRIDEWKKTTMGIWQGAGVTFMDFAININSTVGLAENSLDNMDLVVFPNPVKTLLYLQNANAQNILVTDVFGQTVFAKQIIDQNNEIDLSPLPCGMYFLSVTKMEHKKTIKIIKE